ncbi:nitrogen regulation protein NR(II) [Cytobacillus sp. Hz8]|uniref:two-component system sensor histidine kinase NtrB n=1 Tax=Cytobacillus sp. Hz8 TaxID=3347168 RepID=UPI0035DB79BB
MNKIQNTHILQAYKESTAIQQVKHPCYNDSTSPSYDSQKQSKNQNLTDSSFLHEIKNPLTTIRGLLQLIKLQWKDPKLNQYTTMAIHELDRTNNLLEHWLNINKASSVEKQSIQINALVQDLLILYEGEASLKNISITTELCNGNPDIEGNQNQLKQVFINLIKNAFEAIHAKKLQNQQGNIFIRTKVENPWVAIYIKDNGCGMSNSMMDQLFTPYFSTKTNGTGIGLFISREIIHNHNGEIKVSSFLGNYTEWVVKFPLNKKIVHNPDEM